MFRRLVVATDLSPASERVLECVAGWSALGLRLVTLAHVHAVRTVGGLEEAIRRDHEPKMERQATRLRAFGVPADWRLAFGVPYLDLNQIATDMNADAIVIGSHGASRLREVLLGSVADAILRHSARPVLVLKIDRLVALEGGDCSRACGGLFARVLFPTDFSDAAERALGRMAECCRRMASAVHVLHVQDVRRVRPHLEGQIDELNRVDTLRLERIAEHLRAAGSANLSQEVVVDLPCVRSSPSPSGGRRRSWSSVGPGGDGCRTGTPFYEINRVAERSDASLIVVGSFGQSLISEVLLGSTAHAVLQHADFPVLLIRIAITVGGEAGERCRVVCNSLFEHVLFLTDCSDAADRAFLFLEHIAREAAPEISLLHVQDGTKLDPHLSHRLEEFDRIDDDRLERMRLRLHGRGASKVSTEVAYEKPAPQQNLWVRSGSGKRPRL